jgi:predicted protein tyrosine phosphatase
MTAHLSARLPLSLASQIRATAGSADRVDSHVFIGGYLAAADGHLVRQAGITRIVQLVAAPRIPGVQYLAVPVEDSPEADIRAAAAAAVSFIQDGIRANERVLVHCQAGISRSATVVLLHLMVNRGHSLATALVQLRLARPFISPNPGFMKHLRATDARLRRLRADAADAAHTSVAAPFLFGTDHDAALPLRHVRDGHAGSPADSLVSPGLPVRPGRRIPWEFVENDGPADSAPV